MFERFQEPSDRIVRKFCTYVMENGGVGFNFRPATLCDEITPADDDKTVWLSQMSFRLQHDKHGEVEIVGVRVHGEHAPIMSAALEVAAQHFLERDENRWRQACEWLDEHGTEIEPERAAAA